MPQTFNKKNQDILININGDLVHRDQAGISPFDSVVQGGDAVWEGLRLYDGRIFKLREHLARLRSSAKAMAFEMIPDDEYFIREIRRTLEANGMTDGVHIRVTLTRGIKITSGEDPRLNQTGPTLIVLAEHRASADDRSELALITSSIRRFPPDCLDPKIHHTNLVQSILAKTEANNAGVDDALMLDTRGFVAETTAAHVFIVEGGAVITPQTIACPEGITRSTVIDICMENRIPCHVTDISLTEIYRADEMFCSGTTVELAAVTSVDGRTIGDGEVGPLTWKLAELFQEETVRAGDLVV